MNVSTRERIFALALFASALAAGGASSGCGFKPAAGERDAGLGDLGDATLADSAVEDPGPQIEAVGGDTLVTVERGSLIEERPTDDRGRFDGLVRYLRSDPAMFGAAGVEPDALTFEQAVEQGPIADGEGQTYTLVALHQTFRGAQVIDETQMAIFASSPDGDELRGVRAHLRDPATLPVPPDPAAVSPGRIQPAVDDLIATYDLSPDSTVIGDAPAIVAADDIAGYTVSEVVRERSGSLSRFRAIVDPNGLRVVVIVRQPPCDASRPVPPGSTVVEAPHAGFPVPGISDLRFIHIQAVVLSDDNGSNTSSITREQIRIWVDEANKVWAPQAKIFFVFDDAPGSTDVSSWSSTVLNTEPANDAEDSLYSARANLVAKVLYPHRLVVLFRKRGNPGWSWGPQTNFFVSMPEYTSGGIYKPLSGGTLRNDTLLSHELGHYMGLAHTFPGADCSELTPLESDGDADGQRPNKTNDDVLDTNADMSDVCYPTNSLMCVGGGALYNDFSWLPPWNNVMSYHDCLPEDFSPGQIAVIDLTLTDSNRSVLLD